MDFLQLFSAAGLGAILTTLIQAWLNLKSEKYKQIYKDKRDIYMELWKASHRSEVEQSEEAGLYAGMILKCCLIFANKDVNRCLQELIRTNPIEGHGDHQDRGKALDNLLKAMREDLGIPYK